MQNSSGITINAGRLHSSRSPVQHFLFRLNQLPFVKRFTERHQGLWILATVAFLVSCALLFQVTRAYVATTDLSLPGLQTQLWPTDDNDSLLSNTQTPHLTNFESTLLRLAIIQAGVRPSEGSRYTIRIRPVADSSEVLLIISGPDRELAATLSNVASQIIMNEAQMQWRRSVKSILGTSSGTSLDSGGEVIQAATADHALVQYSLHKTLSRVDYVIVLLAICGITGMVMLAVPNRRAQRSFVLNHPDSKRTASGMNEIPTLATFRFTADHGLGFDPSIHVTPTLGSWFDGRISDELPYHGREFLIARAGGSGFTSRLATMELAKYVAKTVSSVLVIDADIVAGWSEQSAFGFEDVPGLTDLLWAQADVDDCLMEDDETSGLCAIAVGQFPVESIDAASVALKSAKLLDILDKLHETADVILIHGPDLLDGNSFSDLAKRADATLMVLSGDPDDASARAVRALHSTDANLIGSIDVERQNPRVITTDEPVIGRLRS